MTPNPQPLPIPPRAWRVLALSTLAFTVCFMVWMMFAVIGIPLRQSLDLNATQFGLLPQFTRPGSRDRRGTRPAEPGLTNDGVRGADDGSIEDAPRPPDRCRRVRFTKKKPDR